MRRPARGISLVEIMVVMAIIGVLISSTGVCIHNMFRAHDRIQKNLQRQASLERLALRLRADAHGSTAASGSDNAEGTRVSERLGDVEADFLMFSRADGKQITYAVGEAGIVRTVRIGGAVAHRDVFRISGAEQVQCEIRPEPRPMVVLTIPQGVALAPPAPVAAVPYTIQAVVGLHR